MIYVFNLVGFRYCQPVNLFFLGYVLLLSARASNIFPLEILESRIRMSI